jgi:hypothetical protein
LKETEKPQTLGSRSALRLLCAIGIRTNEGTDKLCYISTFGVPAGRYNCHVDVWPAGDCEMNYEPLARFDNVDFEGLVRIVTQHLGLRATAPDGAGD